MMFSDRMEAFLQRRVCELMCVIGGMCKVSRICLYLLVKTMRKSI